MKEEVIVTATQRRDDLRDIPLSVEALVGTQLTGELLRGAGVVDAKEQAVFFDLTRHLSERCELGLGGRLFRQSTIADLDVSITAVQGLVDTYPVLLGVLQPLIDALPVLGAVPYAVDQGNITETKFNPKLTLQWRYSEGLSLVGSAAMGFRPAGANQNILRDPNIPLFFKSDELWNYELGVRSRWLSGALQIDATIFQIDWTDFQIQQRDYLDIFPYITNVGCARNRGAELSIDVLHPSGVALRLSGAYVDARTTRFFDDFQGPAPAGSELPGSAPFTGSALLLWARPIGSAAFVGTATYTYQNGNFNNLPHDYKHPPLGLLGASLSLQFPKWRGRPLRNLVANNLTNEFKPGVVFETAKSNGILTVFNPPRSITLGVEFSFGDT
ncbi:MAG: TonB-dependent receptor domain-containing protein [Panacagrimonas sp.]